MATLAATASRGSAPLVCSTSQPPVRGSPASSRWNAAAAERSERKGSGEESDEDEKNEQGISVANKCLVGCSSSK
eukprot:scaffold8011_cov146-Isochrysis_galbana.AAC.7